MHYGLGMRTLRHGMHRTHLSLQSRCLRGPDRSPDAPVDYWCMPSSLPGHSSSPPFQKQEKEARRTHLHCATEEVT